ncbi:MAG: YbaB/EbfC family nucleoid-associated protein [Eubacteriales bacterium]
MKVRLPKGEGPQNMQSMLKQAQKMQEDMAALQEELENRTYEVSAGGGAVVLKMSGKRELLEMTISPEIVDPDDVETLQDILTAAVNQAIKKVDDTAGEEMAKLTGPAGMGMGGLPGLF